jgi:hypothetical protein
MLNRMLIKNKLKKIKKIRKVKKKKKKKKEEQCIFFVPMAIGVHQR